jgi:hypothetical protein
MASSASIPISNPCTPGGAPANFRWCTAPVPKTNPALISKPRISWNTAASRREAGSGASCASAPMPGNHRSPQWPSAPHFPSACAARHHARPSSHSMISGSAPACHPDFSQASRLYNSAPRDLGPAGRNALAALERIQALTATPYSPSGGASYAADSFASGLNQVARLIKGRVGLQAATLDLGGWDSHITQSVIMDPPMQRLAARPASLCHRPRPGRTRPHPNRRHDRIRPPRRGKQRRRHRPRPRRSYVSVRRRRQRWQSPRRVARPRHPPRRPRRSPRAQQLPRHPRPHPYPPSPGTDLAKVFPSHQLQPVGLYS